MMGFEKNKNPSSLSTFQHIIHLNY